MNTDRAKAARRPVGPEPPIEPAARRPVAVVLLLLPLLVTVLWLAATRWQTPSDGTVTGRLGGWQDTGVLVDDVFDPTSALRPGDRVAAVDGVPVAVLVTRPGALSPRIGQQLRYGVLRPAPGAASRRPIDVPVTLHRYPLLRGLSAHPEALALAVTMYLVAAFVIVRRPRQPAARALYALAVTLPVSVTSFPLGPQAIEVASRRLLPYLAGDLANCLLWGALLHFALVFPGPPASLARRRGVVPAGYLMPFLLYLVRLAVSLPGRAGTLPRLEVAMVVSQTAAHVQPVLVGVAMVVGYRAADDELARRRLRWAFVTFGVAAICYLVLGQLSSRLIGRPLVPWDWLVVLFVPFPVALGLAVLRYRLFDIQVILRRSLVFGALTAVLGTLYLSVATGLGRLVWAPSALAPFVASLAVALLFVPLRAQARRVVSRSLFGDRDDPYEVIDRLGRRLEATASADSVLATLVESLVETLRLSYAAITLRGADERTVRYGRPGPGCVRFPIVHAGERVGDLEIDAGPGREPFGVNDRRLLDGLARQVGVISQNLLLEGRLRQSLERLVTAREEERRRLRRDLHDGLGPTLASAAMQTDLAGALLTTDPERAQKILAGLSVAHREAVDDLRRLVDGLRPPVLDRLGLVGALRERAAGCTPSDGGVSIAVEAGPDVEPLPAAVEVAAYRIAQEAITNVARHADAHRCVVRLWRDASALLLEIRDDGCGLAPGYRAGVGLSAIRERAIELSGSATVTPGPDGGTVVLARLPVRTGD